MAHVRTHALARLALFVPAAMAVFGSPALGQEFRGMPAVVISNAPIYVKPQILPMPLRTAAVNTRLQVLAEQEGWVQVEFQDPQFGPRVGWVEAKHLRIERPELQPMDLSAPAAARPGRPPRQAPTEPVQPAPVADPAAGTRPLVDRRGFLIGFSVGPGFVSCQGCDWRTGLALDLHLGGMLNDRVGLMYDSVASAVNVDGVTVTLATSTLAAQYFTGGRGWIKGGAGVSVVSCDGCFIFDASETGLGLMGGGGVELVQRGRFTVDLQGRFTTNFFEGIRFYTTMATVGFNWY